MNLKPHGGVFRPLGGLVAAGILTVAALGVPARALAQGGASPSGPATLPLPYISQGYWQLGCSNGQPRTTPNWNGRNNCGPASLAMIGQANGKRPGPMTNKGFVAQIRAGISGLDQPCNALLGRGAMDAGARNLGLCSMGSRDEAWSTAAVEALTQACLPVLVFVKSDQIAWPHHPGWYQGSEHIMLVTGFSGSGGAKRAHVSDPLDHSGQCRPNEQDPNAICGGPYTVPYADLDKALRLSSRGWWGKAYGERLGSCDLAPRCGGGGGGGGGGGVVEEREPYRHIALRMASTCPEPKVWIAYDTTATPADAPVAPYVKTFSLINDGYFRTYDFRMDGARTSQFFKGTLKALRIQPSETPGCDVAFSYIALHDGDGDIARQWRFAEGRGGWWAANMIDRDLPGSWQLTTSGGAPFIQRDGLDIDLRR
jgi:hypothetical protein